MGDYFAALAERALRPEIGLQPRQRVRWEEVPEPMAERSPAAEEIYTDGARTSLSHGSEPPRRSRRKSAAEASPPESEPAAPRPRQEHGRRKGAGDRNDTIAATSPPPHPTVRAVEPVVQVRFERVAAPPGDAAGKGPAVAGGRRAAAARSIGIEPARPATRLPARERESAAPEPTIRIHIGRVDVRAVTTAASGSPPVPRDRRRALMSLEDYVQKRDRGVS